MKIELNVKSDGKVVCLIDNGDGKYRYDNFIDYRLLIMNVIKNVKYIDIYDGNIYCDDGTIEFSINNYANNTNPTMNRIINMAQRKFLDEKKAQLRKKKINRAKSIAKDAVIIVAIAAGVVLFSLSPSPNEYNPNDYVNTTVEETGRTNFIEEHPEVRITEEEEEKKRELEKTYRYKEYVESHSDDSKDYSKPYSDDTLVEIRTDVPNDEHKDNNVSTGLTVMSRQSNNNDNMFSVEYEDRTGTDKYLNSKSNYYSAIERISKKYGIDPRIMLGIGTQEAVNHTDRSNPAAVGKFQLEKSVWNGAEIKAFNYETNSIETVNVTNEKLEDLEFNIKVACMYFQNCLDYSKGNIEVAIQMYNYGYGNVERAFRLYYNNPSLTLTKALSFYDENWLTARGKIGQGDSKYLEHVLSYIEDTSNITCLDSSGNTHTASFVNNYEKVPSAKI